MGFNFNPSILTEENANNAINNKTPNEPNPPKPPQKPSQVSGNTNNNQQQEKDPQEQVNETRIRVEQACSYYQYLLRNFFNEAHPDKILSREQFDEATGFTQKQEDKNNQQQASKYTTQPNNQQQDKQQQPAKEENVNESDMIHGIDFNGHTLFDNAEKDDFNRTEWMDLQLCKAQADFENEVLEAYRVAYYQECMMWMNGTASMDKLREINEAFDKASIKNSFGNLYDAIQNIFNKFAAKLDGIVNADKPYLTKYKAIIMNSAEPAELFPMSTNGFIFKGLEHLKGFEFPDFEYSTQNVDKFKDKDTYFKEMVVGKFRDAQSAGNYDPNSGPYVNWLKKYFGGPYTQDNSVQIQMKDFSDHKQSMFDFLMNPTDLKNRLRNAMVTIRKNADNKDRMSVEMNKAANDATAQANNGNTNNSNTNNQTNNNGAGQAKQEAVFSFIKGEYITELQVEKQGAVDPNAKTVKDSNNNYVSAKRVYINVMNDILRAQMTSIEYIRSEYRAAIKAKVKYYKPNAEQEFNNAAQAAKGQADKQTGA